MINNFKKPVKIAIMGKGGVGKTVITVLITKIISEYYKYKLLLIDADPTHPHLCNMVKVKPNKSLEELRIEAVKKAHRGGETVQKLAERIDFDVYEGMAESKNFCLFSIGQPEGPGCFCPSNTLLRRVIESISKDFDIILIDGEAGLEQINRMVLKSIDILLIITDLSLRSIETANSIRNQAKKYTNYRNLGVLINKAKGNINIITKKLKELELPLIGSIPEDNVIIEFDLEGKPLIDVPEDSISYMSLKDAIEPLFSSFN
ncbi:MAG: AAA family ATPase [Candidatus Hermodarchaeota archaeon]